jgi:uncharacterized membrane protein YphA (DoxX/SURF4 family)
METLLWTFQIALAVLFAFAGVLKLTRSREELAPRMEWVVDATDAQVKAVGVLELMAAVGLVLPAAIGIVPTLTALAAVGVVLLMAGAIKTNVSTNELNRLPINVVIAALALWIAVERFS